MDRQEHPSDSESSLLPRVISDLRVQIGKSKVTKYIMIWPNKIGILKLRARDMMEKVKLSHKKARDIQERPLTSESS